MRIALYIHNKTSDKFESLFKPYDFSNLNILMEEMRELLRVDPMDLKSSRKDDCLLYSRTTTSDVLNSM